MRSLMPQTLFGRLFAATVGVVALTVLIVVVLIVRERREYALLESGAGASAANIAELAEYLATLPPEERRATVLKLHEQRMAADDVRLAHRAAHLESSARLQRLFTHKVRERLGRNFEVTSGPPRAPPRDVIPLSADARPDGTGAESGAPGVPRRLTRVFDVRIKLPDGEELVFRTRAPRPAPRLPAAIFVHLAVLTVALTLVLYAMTRTITRPLADLAHAADAIGRGEHTPQLHERGSREIRRATRAFNAMQERLHRYLDSRTRVLAAMSHDLRTPLTRLRLRVESIEDETLRQQCAADLDEMAAMVRGALAMFRGLNEDEAAASVDIDALVRELVEELRELGAEVTIAGGARAAYVAKPLALKRCLRNLLQNAVQYGSHVAVRIEDGNDLIIRVEDGGPGIPEDKLEHVFEPLFRLESSRNRDTGGAGLGLSIARDIAQAHGGSLVLANRSEGGLVATLRLPRSNTASRAG